jgi:hypothetical protein
VFLVLVAETIGSLVVEAAEYTVQDTPHLLVVDLVDLMQVEVTVEYRVGMDLMH